MIEQAKWKWDGYPKHFIAAEQCRFRMSTRIGKWVISTVGDYFPKGAEEAAKIGHERFYETMTFRAVKADCACCDWKIDVRREGDWFGSYNDAKSARKGHMKICKSVAESQ